MSYYRQHRIKLNPTGKHLEYFLKASGTRRFAYNWGLERWRERYTNGDKCGAFILSKEFNLIRKEEYPWTYDVGKSVLHGAFLDLEDAFLRFFKKQNAYPKFKSKKKRQNSFFLDGDKFKVDGHFIRIPKLGWVNMSQPLRFEGKILSATIKQDSVGDWFVTIKVRIDKPHPKTCSDRVVGLDLGIKSFITTSDGQIFDNQKYLAKSEAKIKKLQKSLSRKKYGSKNYEKARVRLAKLHRHVANQRLDYAHKLSTYFTETYGFIALETLNVAGMMKNHKLAKSIGDVGMSQFTTLLESKAIDKDVVLQYVDQFFPSSKQCSQCGHKKNDLKLSDRVYYCDNCGLEIDRDYNASLNILNEGLKLATST